MEERKPIHLRDLEAVAPEEHPLGDPDALRAFAELPLVADLGWPVEVVEQWLYDHLGNGSFRLDYGHLDLARIVWTLERVPTALFHVMTTGASESRLLAENADQHRHWTSVRQGVAEAWEATGTWLRPPIVLDGAVLGRPGTMQVVEGRTRVGILRGRSREALRVAESHWSWIGRQR